MNGRAQRKHHEPRPLALKPCRRHPLDVPIAGGSIGLGANNAIVLSTSDMAEGIHTAFLVDPIVALCGAVVALFFVGGPLGQEKIAAAWPHHHRARVQGMIMIALHYQEP